jgi:ATP-dependent protease HslVU (ClpYQ) peptidase subunit
VTCIVAIKDGGKVHMGCDSIGTDGWRKQARTRPKLFKKGPLLIGYCGSFRMADLLEFNLDVPKLLPDEDLPTWMVKELVPAVRTNFKEGGYATKHDDAERGGDFLIAVRGRLFCIESDYQVGETTREYAALGSGEPFAMGSLFGTEGRAVLDRLQVALEAAHEMCATVAPPFHFLAED